MKKIISLLLALVLCLSLCACGESSQGVVEDSKDTAIVGEWKSLEGSALIFDRDGTVAIGYVLAEGIDIEDIENLNLPAAPTWLYDENKGCYTLTADGMSFDIVIEEADDGLSFDFNGVRYYHAYYFEKLFENAPADLVGEWYLDASSAGMVDYIIYEFDEDGTVYHMGVDAYDSGHKVSWSGAYVYRVRGNTIYCYPEVSGGSYEFTYEVLDDGTILLYRNYSGEEMILVKGNWNDYLESNR